MPFEKMSFRLSKPLVLNRNYMRTKTGLLKCGHCLLGLVSLLSIWFACRSNYDPYLGTYSGFVGGDIETCTLLMHFTCFFVSLLVITTYYFSIVASTIIPKTVFEFVYNIIAFTLLCLTSSILFITVINRNQNSDVKFSVEPGFGGKLTTSIIGIMNSVLYAADSYFSYRAYTQD